MDNEYTSVFCIYSSANSGYMPYGDDIDTKILMSLLSVTG